MTAIEKIEAAVKAYEGVVWTSSGYPLQGKAGEAPTEAGWVKFGIAKTELGWRTLEYLAWVVGDMLAAGERLRFFPTAPPPYLNTPGECLSFVIECFPQCGDQVVRFGKVAEFINWCRKAHWSECHTGLAKGKKHGSGAPGGRTRR